MTRHSLSLTYQKSFFKEETSDKDLSPSQKLNEKQRKEKEAYFDTSDSDADFYLTSQQVIAERSSDNAFGRFDELIGSGAFKRVYRGYDFNAGREIAWSIINVTSDSPEHSLEKIAEEISILKQLDHPNVIHFIKGWFDEEKNQIALITELVSGGSLRSNLKRIREPRLRLVKKWIREILAGLDYLHKKSIIHRDIKCDNLFLDSIKGSVKIGDLGGSQLLKSKYATRYVGTEEFMSPEVYEGKYTVKADVYSLGMSIIEMLTLEKPYKECEGPMAIYYNITHGVLPESLGKIDNENVTQFIKQCLKRENERLSSSELLNNEWLNDTTSKENDHPVRIINHLRQKIISSKNAKSNWASPPFNLSAKQLDKPKLKPKPYHIDVSSNYGSASPVSSPTHSENTIHKDCTSKFVITIKEPGEGHQLAEHFNPKDFDQLHSHSNEVEINFIVKRDKWKNKKLLKCSYNLDNDTVSGLASELQKAIDLNEEECQIVKHKLNESLTHYTSNSNCSSQRNTVAAATEEAKDPKHKSRYNCFQSSFTALTERIKALLNDYNTKTLEKIASMPSPSDPTPNTALTNRIDSFKPKHQLLISIISQSEAIHMSSYR